MSEYTLKIGATKGVSIKVGKARKIVLQVRDALREAGVEADVIVEREPKVLD